MRTNAANWLELSEKVYHYRRDLMSVTERGTLQQATETVRQQLRARADSGKLKLGIEALEGVLRRVGGTHYPKSNWTENVEFFLVAAIVILGVRAYFVQPFKIPTNSMWPSYYGMTPEVFAKPSDEPGAAMRLARLAALGALPRKITADEQGEVQIPIISNGRRAMIQYREVAGRSWLIFPARLKEYRLLIGNHETAAIRVPMDFDFEWAVRDAFFPKFKKSHEPGGVDLARLLNAQTGTQSAGNDQTGRVYLLRTGKQVTAGESVLSFDILTGDQLFVDRISYNFVRPRVGEGFVFATENIHSPYMQDSMGNQVVSYYIKRLVGLPGDRLQVKNFTLYRNGTPITGSAAFEKNAHRDGDYVGYRNEGSLADEQILEIPPDSYFAMGDNSANSGDGRYWGDVPAKDVIGRPLFIYYPLSKRWGIAP